MNTVLIEYGAQIKIDLAVFAICSYCVINIFQRPFFELNFIKYRLTHSLTHNSLLNLVHNLMLICMKALIKKFRFNNDCFK